MKECPPKDYRWLIEIIESYVDQLFDKYNKKIIVLVGSGRAQMEVHSNDLYVCLDIDKRALYCANWKCTSTVRKWLPRIWKCMSTIKKIGAGIQKYGSEIENVPVRYKNGKVGKNVRVQSATEWRGLKSVWVQLRKLSWESNNIVTV